MSEHTKSVSWLRGPVGLLAGGVLGYQAFFFLARQGFYAMILPGTMLGLGCGVLSGVRSLRLGIASGLSAVLLGIYTEWRFAPFVADDSFSYFIWHLGSLKPVTLVMIAVGGLCGFWLGQGRSAGG